MTLTGGYHRLTKDQEGSSIDITCIKIAKINVSQELQDCGVGLLVSLCTLWAHV